MNMSDVLLHIGFLLELCLTFRYFTVNILVFVEIFDMVGKAGLFEELGRATDFAACDQIFLLNLWIFFLNILIFLPGIVQGLHVVFIFLFSLVHHDPGCIQAHLLDLCLVFEEKLFVLDGDILQVEKGKENVFAGRADMVWEESGVLQACFTLFNKITFKLVSNSSADWIESANGGSCKKTFQDSAKSGSRTGSSKDIVKNSFLLLFLIASQLFSQILL